jgi:hypothetical protein
LIPCGGDFQSEGSAAQGLPPAVTRRAAGRQNQRGRRNNLCQAMISMQTTRIDTILILIVGTAIGLIVWLATLQPIASIGLGLATVVICWISCSMIHGFPQRSSKHLHPNDDPERDSPKRR